MDGEKVLELFKKTGALLKGHFELSSGKHSNTYIQCALLLQHPRIAERLCSQLAAYFKDDNPTCVVGPALGGIIVSYEVARALCIRSIFTERKDNIMMLRRGFDIEKTDRVLIVEDVITTGLSTKEVIDIVKERGATIVGIGAIVDRSGKKLDFGVKSKNLVTIDLPIYESMDCPLCKRDIPIIKPGSRFKR